MSLPLRPGAPVSNASSRDGLSSSSPMSRKLGFLSMERCFWAIDCFDEEALLAVDGLRLVRGGGGNPPD